MKNIGMKNNMTEKIRGVWGESLKNLKNLKSLMQIFAETDKTDKTDKAIFATFATFAMQIFKRPDAATLRTVPMESTVKVAQRSRIPSYLPLLATVLMLTLGGWNSVAWGDWSAVPYYNSGDSKWYSLYDESWTTSTWSSGVDLYPDIFPPTDGDLTLQWKKNYWMNDVNVYLNGNKIDGGGTSTDVHTKTTSIGEDVTTANLGIYGSGSSGGSFGDFKILLARHIRLDNDDNVGVTSKSGTVANTAYGSTSVTAYHINLRSFLMQNNGLRYVSSNSEFHFGEGVYDKTFAVKANACAFGSGESGYDCTDAGKVGILGNPDSYEVDVYFTPSENYYGTRSTTITIYDGATARATITLTAKVIPTYYFKATSVATDGTSTLDIPVKASFESGIYSGSTLTVSQTAATADVESLSKTAYFYAPASKDDYQFQGWYETAACNGERVSTDNTISFNITSSALSEGTAAAKTYYAKYLEEIRAEFGGSNQVLMVDGGYDGISYSRTSEEHPTAAASAAEAAAAGKHFWYEIIIDEKTDVTTGSADDSKVIDFDPSSNHVTAVNAGTARLILHQEATGLYVDVDKTYTFTVNKHTTEFHWNEASTPFYYKSDIEGIFSSNTAVDRVESSNPVVAEMEGTTLHIYNVNETTNITFTKEEDYKWTGLEQTYEVTPVNRNNHLPLSTWSWEELTKFLIDSETHDDDDHAWWNDGGVEISYNNDNWREDKYLILGFEGMPDSLFFRHKLNGNKSSLWYVTVGSSLSNVTDTIWKSTSNSSSWSDLVRLGISPTVRYIKFGHKGQNDARFKDISITALNKFSLDAGSIEFGLQGTNYGRQLKTISFNHANAGRITQAEIIGTDADYYSVEPEVISGTGRDLYGSVALRVYFDNKGTTRDADEPYIAQLRVYDSNGHSQTANLSGYRNGKNIPVFTFNPNHTAYYVGTTINTPAVSTNKQTGLTITSEQTNIVEVVAGGLHMKAVGTATIVVSQEETTDYRAHSERYTITTREMPSLALPFALTKTVCTAEATFYGVENGSWNDDENAIRLGNGNGWPNGWGVRGFQVEFSGVPDSLTFGYKASRGTVTHDISMGAPYFYVEESPDGDDETWTQVWFKKDNNTTTNFVKVALKPTTQFVRFVYDGNYYAFYNNISITRLDGTKYMMTGDGKYLSRGADYGTSAIVDDFGTPVRVTRYTTDNTNIYTKVQFMDSREYLLELEDNVYTDNGSRTAINWIQIPDGTGKVKVQSGNGGGKYITLDGNGKLVLTSTVGDATLWTAEDYSIHHTSIDAKLDKMVKEAAKHDFGDNVNTLAQMRTFLVDEDFDMEAVEIEDVELTEHKGVDADRTSSYSATKSGLRPGLYRLTVQALYRPSKSPIDWENHSKGTEGIVAYVYANDTKYPIKSVFDETGARGFAYSGKDTVIDGFHYPIDKTAAGDAFSDPLSYMHDLYVYVDAGLTTGTLNYGIENASYVPGAWLVYDNFTLARVARKEYVFDGNEGSSTTWGEEDNWEYQGEPAGSIPGAYNAVTIQNDVEIVGRVSVYSLSIEGDAKVTIAPNGGLTVGKGGVSGVNSSNLKLEASSDGKTGYIRISPEYAGEMPTATVEMFTKAYYNRETSTAVWQCVGVPVEETALMAKNVFTNSYLYNWDESINGWYNKKSKTRLTPFTGYETTQAENADGLKVIYSGHLVSGHETHKVDLRCSDIDKGYNALANSFAAPIAIANFEAADFENTENTIYILNAGTKAQSDDPVNGVNAAGKFLNIPIGSAVSMASEFGTPLMIPSMQGFWVRARSTNNPTSITFNYDRLVWQAEYDADSNKPLRAPKRNVEEEEEKLGALKVTLFANGEVDHLYMLESEQYNVAFENGYDAHKMMNEGMNIFSVVEDEYLAVDATNSIVGTRIGVRTGEETAYTLVFSHVNSGDDLMLWDIEAEEKIEISEEQTYTFFAEPNSEIVNRFIIIERKAPELTTGVEPTSDSSLKGRATKFVKDDQLYILKNGVLYDATGKRVQ